MRKYLENNLNWKVYSIDEYTGIVACDFIDMEFSAYYDGSDFVDIYPDDNSDELANLALNQGKSRIINDILDFLQEHIDGVHRVVYNHETGELDNFTWRVEGSKKSHQDS